MNESAYYIAKNASTLHAFWAKLWLSPMRFLQEYPYHSWDVPRITAGVTPTKKGRVYKIAMQTHVSTNSLSYSPTSHLLECDLLWFNSAGIWITSYSLTTASWWRGHRSIPQPGRWLAVWRGSVLNPHKVLGLWNHHMGGEMHDSLDIMSTAPW